MHPSREELSGYVLGTLLDDAAKSVEAHLEHCTQCEQTLQELEDTCDTVIETLRRSAPTDPYQQEAGCRRMQSMIAAIGRDPSLAATEVAAQEVTPEPALSGELGDYVLLEKLGDGGMGVVYKARHKNLGRTVALKVIAKGRERDDRALARFRREMRAVGRLDHPNIVEAHDAREIGGTWFLVMQYVEGLNLSQLVKRCGPLGVADACELARQAALGLQYAHEHGLVHRDIKPSNLILGNLPSPANGGRAGGISLPSPACGRGVGGEGAQPQVKILDLGLALLRDVAAAAAERTGSEAAGTPAAMASDRQPSDRPSTDDLTGTTQVMGTWDYIAPEQTRDAHEVDIRADIYSLGCTLYKLLTGRAPFEGPDYDSPARKLVAHAQVPAPPIRQQRPEVPDQLAAIVDRMLAKSPDERFATPAEVAEALQPWAAGSDLAGLLGAGAKSLPLPLGLGAGAKSPPLPLGEGRGEGRRRRLALAAGGAAVIALLGIVLTVSTGKGTVQLEFADAEAARQCTISIDGDEIRLENLGEPIKLWPGKHQLRVTHGELEIETREFKVLRHGTQVLHVSIPGLAKELGVAEAGPPARKSTIRWLGYTVRNHPTKSVAEIAEYTNIVFDHGWPNYGDELIKAARKAGLKVVLAFYGGNEEKDLFADKGIVLARDNRDVVFAVCWYAQNAWTPSGLPTFGASLKRQLPGIELWAAFLNRLPPEDFAVPDAVDVLLASFRGQSSAPLVRREAAAAFPYWKDRAKGRPVLLYWDCWFRKRPAGRLIGTWAGTMYACAQAAEQYALSGVIFDNYGTEAADIGLRRSGPVYENYGLEAGDLVPRLERNISVGMGLQTRPELIMEIKRVAREVGVGKESSVSGKPAGLDLQIGNAQVAIAAYSEVIRSSPAAFEQYFERGLFYLETGDMERAIGDFRHAVRLKSDLPLSWCRWLCWWLPTTIDSRSKLPGIVFVSDMPWVRSTCGTGGQPARCSGWIKAVDSSGLPYSRSVHNYAFSDASPADVVLDISGQNFATFKSQVGCRYSHGTVQFQVLVDGEVKHQTPVLRQGAVDTISVDVKGAKEVVLRVLNGGDGNEDGTDGAAWGSARFVQAGAADLLEEPGEIRFATDASSALLLAEVHWRLNEKDLARRWFDAAAEWMDKNEPDDENLRRYRAEAAELLGIAKEPSKEKDKAESA